MRGLMGLALLLVGLPAAAREVGLPLELYLTGCEDVRESEVQRILAAELGTHAPPQPSRHSTQVSAQCEGPHLKLDVLDPLSRKRVGRKFDLSSAPPEARGRLLAIAAAELVLASWAELEQLPSLRVEPEGARAPAVQQQLARERLQRRKEQAPQAALVSTREVTQPAPSRSWYSLQSRTDRMFRVAAIASGRSFFNHDGVLWGGGLRLGEERLVATSWAADALFESGQLEAQTGRYAVETWTLGGAVFFYVRPEPLTARIGAGLRLGIAAASAVGNSESSSVPTITPWGWPLATSSVSLRLARYLTFEASGEAGYAVLPLSGRTGGYTIRGAWFSGQLGIALIP